MSCKCTAFLHTFVVTHTPPHCSILGGAILRISSAFFILQLRRSWYIAQSLCLACMAG
jgi:hypothetical protein